MLFSADQVLKAVVRDSLSHGEQFVLIPGVLYITHLQNTGAAFGILEGRQQLIVLVSLVFLGLLLAVWRELLVSLRSAIGLAAVLGGSFGNVYDRIRLNAVTDFVDIRIWPVFNLADVLIVCGLIVVAMDYLVREYRKADDAADSV